MNDHKTEELAGRDFALKNCFGVTLNRAQLLDR